MTPTNPKQQIEEALRHHRAGDLAKAEQIYRRILTQNPNHPDALHLLGVVAHQVGKHQDAVNLISHAIRHNPRETHYHINLGEALSSLQRLDDALAEYRTAIQLNPRDAHAWNNVAAVLLFQEKLDESIDASRSALSINPDDLGAHANLGIALYRQGEFDKALDILSRAVKLHPNSPEAHCNLGNALLPQNRIQEAINAFRRALAIDPNHALAHNNLALALQQIGLIEEAVQHYKRAIEIRPRYTTAHHNLLLALHYLSNISREEIFQAHVRWADLFVPAGYAPPPHDNDRNPDRPIRIGVVSNDFLRHSVAFFLEPLLRELDRAQFPITCYSATPNPDDVTAVFQDLATQWTDIRGQNDDQIADRIRADRIDILIDLAGHTAANHLMVFARKPAPIQVTYLGYPDTTGLKQIDYRITDAIADPISPTQDSGLSTQHSFHTETLLHLNRCAWCYQPPEVAPPITPRAENPITFGSFNTLAKLTPKTLDLWAQILNNLPTAHLVLKAHGTEDPSARERILNHFSTQNINPSRITLLGRQPTQALHLEAYNQIDIALDTFPYHGTTTTCDALWMGVPVITLAGDRHVSRVGVSLLTTVGLEDLIAKTPEEYIDIATTLASDRDRLIDLRQTLRQRMKQSPLTDAPSLAREFESTFRTIFRAWCSR